MKGLRFCGLLCCLLVCLNASAQGVTLTGYAYADNNEGYIQDAEVKIFEDIYFKSEVKTAEDGSFSVTLLPNKLYRIKIRKSGFEPREDSISTFGKTDGEKLFLKVPLTRAPGYIFEAAIVQWKEPSSNAPIIALTDAKIEIYNNTTDEEELVIEANELPSFTHTFDQGYHYTIMIRKQGYFTRRIEAYIDVEGCILCIDGVGTVRPGIQDNLTEGHTKGILAADVELREVAIGEAIEVNNIYYDFNKWNIRSDAAAELDKLADVLKDNPKMIVELGSHTDSRGTKQDNLELSEKRAKAVVDYLVYRNTNRDRLAYKGYGESQLRNRCRDGVRCSEEEHQENRRTEFKVLGYLSKDPYERLSLREIIQQEKIDRLVNDLDQTVVEIPNDSLAISETSPIETDSLSNNSSIEPPPYLAETYTGYTIEVLESTIEVTTDHPIFRDFDFISLEQPEPSMYIYLVGDFTDLVSAIDFLQQEVLERYPVARVVRYRDGKRIKLNDDD